MPRPTSRRQSKHYSGILPKKGWPERNLRYLRYRLVPQMFKRLDGDPKHPELAPPPDGMARITWIGHASLRFDSNCRPNRSTTPVTGIAS